MDLSPAEAGYLANLLEAQAEMVDWDDVPDTIDPEDLLGRLEAAATPTA